MTDPTSIELDAQAAYEAIRSINHATIFTGEGIPAPVIYRVLGFLQGAGGYGLAQALSQLARGLERSLSTYDVCEDDGRDPVDSIAHAANALTDAADLLQRVAPLLDDAQAAISCQGYRATVLEDLHDRARLMSRSSEGLPSLRRVIGRSNSPRARPSAQRAKMGTWSRTT